MKNKFAGTFIDKNPSELSPWQSEIIPTSTQNNTNNLQPIAESLTITKRFLPKVIRHERRSSYKFQKIQYQLPKKQILSDDKTFELIKSARETAFNGFITKYKMPNQSKNRRYLMVTKQELLNFSLQLPDKVKFVNYTSLHQEDQSQDSLHSHTYQSKQFQFSRKRSLSNLIKSIRQDKFLKFKEPSHYSPWTMTNCLSPEKINKQHNDPHKTQKNMKLLQLNLGIRQRNNPNHRTTRNHRTNMG